MGVTQLGGTQTQLGGTQILQEPGDPGPYGPVGRSPWLDVDWREHQRWVMVENQPVNTIQLGREGTQPTVFVHALPGCRQNWLHQPPALAAAHPPIPPAPPRPPHPPPPLPHRSPHPP